MKDISAYVKTTKNNKKSDPKQMKNHWKYDMGSGLIQATAKKFKGNEQTITYRDVELLNSTGKFTW